MSRVAKPKRVLMWTIFFVAMMQMAQVAVAPAIDMINTTVFPGSSLSLIQTVMSSLPSILSVLAGIISSVLIGFGVLSKKGALVAGLFFVVLTGVVAIVMHTQLWQLVLYSVILGVGMGAFIPAAQSIMVDNFDEKERQFMSGLQFSFLNGGGILMSIVGGILTTFIWFGGYIVLLAAFPVAVFAIFSVPADKKNKRSLSGEKPKRNKLPRDVYYYAALSLIHILLYNVGTSNISTHIVAHGLGDAASAGVATALMMGGGVVMGIFFFKVSSALRDQIFALSFVAIFVGYTMLNVFSSSFFMVCVAMVILGTSLSMVVPQIIYRVSNIVDPTNSAIATMYIASVMPGLGGFLSPLVFTELISRVGINTTDARYQFVAFIALALTVLLSLNAIRRDRQGKRNMV